MKIGSLALVRCLASVRLFLLNLLDTVVREETIVPDILRDEECSSICRFLVRLLLLLLGFRAGEPHLRVAWRREHILRLRLACQLLREDLTLNVRVRADVTDGQSDALTHDFCIEVVALDFLLDLPRHEFDWVRVRPMGRLVCLSLHVALVVDQVVIIDDHCRQVLGQFVLKVCIMGISACRLRKRVASDVDNVNRLSQRQIPQTALAIDHVEGDVEFLELLKVIALVEHFRVELEKLVAREIQTLEALD